MSAFLAVLIGLAQVAGPWLCCCQPVAPLNSPAPSAPAERAGTPVSAPTKCAHCCPKAATQPAPAEPAPTPEPADERYCCSQVFTVAVPADSAADSVRALALDGPLLLVGGEPSVGVAPGLDLSPWAAGAFDSPFLPTAARLYAHHALRC